MYIYICTQIVRYTCICDKTIYVLFIVTNYSIYLACELNMSGVDNLSICNP